MLHLLEQAVAEAQSMVRTIAISADQSRYWDEDFRSRWCPLAGRHRGGPSGSVTIAALGEVRADLRRLADDLSTDALAAGQWHEYGGLIVNLRNVIDAVSRVAAARAAAGPRTRRRAPGGGSRRRPDRLRGGGTTHGRSSMKIQRSVETRPPRLRSSPTSATSPPPTSGTPAR